MIKEAKEVYDIVNNFKKMNFYELEATMAHMLKIRKKKEEQYSRKRIRPKGYNEIVEQSEYIINELRKEIYIKLMADSDSDSESDNEKVVFRPKRLIKAKKTDDSPSGVYVSDNSPLGLLDVYSDEE